MKTMTTEQDPEFEDREMVTSPESENQSHEPQLDPLLSEGNLKMAAEFATNDVASGYGREIVDSLRKLIRSFDVQSRRLRDNHQLTLPQLLCLRALIDNGPLTVNGIGTRIHLGASTLVGILDRLEARGLVGRNRNPLDRREVIVAASDAGRSLVGNIHSPLRDGLSHSLNQLPLAEQSTIASSLQRLFDLMQFELQSNTAREEEG
jgi:DNA-binding MarR family transcriptional regulator